MFWNSKESIAHLVRLDVHSGNLSHIEDEEQVEFISEPNSQCELSPVVSKICSSGSGTDPYSVFVLFCQCSVTIIMLLMFGLDFHFFSVPTSLGPLWDLNI
jgi:hypothetical protein